MAERLCEFESHLGHLSRLFRTVLRSFVFYPNPGDVLRCAWHFINQLCIILEPPVLRRVVGEATLRSFIVLPAILMDFWVTDRGMG